MKLIDADTVIEQIAQAQASLSNCSDAMWEINRNYFKGLSWAHRIILDAPEVDPVKHGRWAWDVETHGDPMYGVDEDFGYRCSECKVWADEYGVDGDIYGEPPTHILRYCPNCGAKMDLESEGTDE